MNGYYAAAAAVSFLTVIFHAMAGGVRVVRPMLASELNSTIKAVLYGCWHAFTVLYLGVAAAFMWAALVPSVSQIALAATILAAVLGALSVLVILRFRQRFARLPHWALFLLVALFGALGGT